MESKKLSNRKKLDYEKPGIKEEVTLEQKALACSNRGTNCDKHGQAGNIISQSS